MPANIAQHTDRSMPTATVNWDAPSVNDNSGSQEVTSTHKPGAELPIGETSVTYEAVDSSGNGATESFNITVTGNTFDNSNIL